MTTAQENVDRVVIFAPVGRDGSLMAAALREADFRVEVCGSAADLTECIEDEAGVLLLTIEALEEVDVQKLGELIRRQPPWSDLPIVLLTGSADRLATEQAVFEMGNVTVLERPVQLHSFVAAILSALRARHRQYEVRDLLLRSEIQQAHIEALNERLQRSMVETHHRVKNNLQVIAAMIDLHVLEGKETLSIEEFKRLGLHVRMLASLHDLLTNQAKDHAQVSHVSAKAMIEKLIPMIRAAAPGAQISSSIDDARLPLRQAASLTLLINEVVSNAIKHGGGDVAVTFTTENDSARLVVTDSGPGFPPGFEPARHANTGLDLVENLSHWDMGGAVAYENCPQGGARVTVTFGL
jgi:two-component sensor histidine kinase/CheY-like chemotaxis protein